MHICNYFVSYLKAATSKLQANHFGISHSVITVDKVELSCKSHTVTVSHFNSLNATSSHPATGDNCKIR